MASEEDLRRVLDNLDKDEDKPALNYEVTIFDHMMGLNVIDKVRVSRYGTSCLIHQFTNLLWVDISVILVRLDDMAPPRWEHKGGIDDYPYTIDIRKVTPKTWSGLHPLDFPKIKKEWLD